MSIRLTRFLGLLVLAGCSAATAGSTGWQDIRTGVIYFQSVRCEPEGTKCLVPIIVTDDPKDPEAWVTESREKMRALIGIPYGQRPTDIAFPSLEACDRFRTTNTYVKPDEPCRQIHFKRKN